MIDDFIRVRGAKEHNLKNVNIDIPKNKLVVVTGLSGSGKSSLAFDTIYAEGQRRYVESLSSYARQFLQLQNNPKLTMKKDASGKFKLYMIPNQFLNIPNGSVLKEIELTIRKRAWAGGADQIDERVKYKGGCQ